MNMGVLGAVQAAAPAKPRSRAIEDAGPGAYITDNALKQMMLDQGRPIIGGFRDYGREYDDYFVDRRWGKSTPGLTLGAMRAFAKKKRKAPRSRARTARAMKNLAQKRFSKKGKGRGVIKRRRRTVSGLGGNTGFLIPEDLTIGGLGSDLPPPESVDLLTAVREIYGIAIDVKPLAEFVGAHPIMSVAAFMMVVGAWAGVAAYVGAGGVEITKDLVKALGKK